MLEPIDLSTLHLLAPEERVRKRDRINASYDTIGPDSGDVALHWTGIANIALSRL